MLKYIFQKAKAVWAEGRAEEMNCELAFRAVIPSGSICLELAASSIFRIWINGQFYASGPARIAHGFYSVDRYELEEALKEEQNVLVIEVVGFNVNSYDTLDQPAFLTAELLKDGQVIAFTGTDGISAFELKQRVVKVQRYSFQRAFTECYHLETANRRFFTEPDGSGYEPLKLEEEPEKRYIVRRVRYPRYERLPFREIVSTGKAVFDVSREKLSYDRSYTDIGPELKGFLPEELEEHLSDEGQRMDWIADASLQSTALPMVLDHSYGIFRFPFNATGFLQMKVSCGKPCVLYVLFDEVLVDGEVDFLRLTSCNLFKYYLSAGEHEITTFAPYTMQYLRIVCRGECRLSAVSMIEYKHPPVAFRVKLPREEKELDRICQAALETWLSNSVDTFSDCPSRERAGWLCDSFFTARVEKVLTGSSVLEKAFLENLIVPERFACLPEGMLPMCYPADHYNGNFIPNWAMWFVLELEEYVRRSGDRAMAEAAKSRVCSLLRYFKKFENEDGLLESLEQWVFIEWSRANDPDVIREVNYPTNMLYARMLEIVSGLYQDPEPAEQAEKIRRHIRSHSFNGRFFTDNERRTEKGLFNPGNMTEVCQYYAFFTRTASPETYPELWHTLLKDFGPRRKETKLHPEVAFANAFIGDYLRIELLYEAGIYDQVLEDIRGYFTLMAERTGTLWEHDSTYASCNHGFASHVIYWLDGIYGKERTEDPENTAENRTVQDHRVTR